MSCFNNNMLASPPGHKEIGIPAAIGSGLAGRALLGWMDRAQAVKFLMEDCLFSPPLSIEAAEEIWESHRKIVENLPAGERSASTPLAMSAADLQAARKFRTKYPGAAGIVDFVRLNPMDLVVHQLWISTAIAEGYRGKVTPDKWLQTALIDPPSNPRLKSRSQGDDITFDLPHSEFFLTVPSQTNEIRVSEGDGFRHGGSSWGPRIASARLSPDVCLRRNPSAKRRMRLTEFSLRFRISWNPSEASPTKSSA